MQESEPQKLNVQFGDRSRYAAATIGFIVLLVVGLIMNVNIGSVKIPASQVFTMLGEASKYYIANLFTGGDYEQELLQVTTSGDLAPILFNIRMPRMLLTAILGGALAVSGFLLQTFFRNPIAGPFVLGISSGAKMMVAIMLIFLAQMYACINSFALMFAAFIGALIVTVVVLFFARKVNDMSMLLVIGVMVGYICNAITSFAITFASDNDIVNLTNWSRGTFSGASWADVSIAAIMCIPALIAAWALSKPMGAYALGEGYALSMGIKIKPFRVVLILLSSVLSACVTALVGPIAFVGVAVPHITRSLLKTSKPSVVIPLGFLCGAVCCIFCDLIARTALAPTELAIGTVTSIFGAPIVIYMLAARRKYRG